MLAKLRTLFGCQPEDPELYHTSWEVLAVMPELYQRGTSHLSGNIRIGEVALGVIQLAEDETETQAPPDILWAIYGMLATKPTHACYAKPGPEKRIVPIGPFHTLYEEDNPLGISTAVWRFIYDQEAYLVLWAVSGYIVVKETQTMVTWHLDRHQFKIGRPERYMADLWEDIPKHAHMYAFWLLANTRGVRQDDVPSGRRYLPVWGY